MKMRSVRVRWLAAALMAPALFSGAVVAPVRAQAPAAPATPLALEPLAKQIQQELAALRKPEEAPEIPFFLGHHEIEKAAVVAQPVQPLVQQTGPVEAATAPPPPPPEPPPQIKCQGVMQLPSGTKVIIGSQAYGVGDTVQNARILQITADTVTFEFKGQRFTAASH